MSWRAKLEEYATLWDEALKDTPKGIKKKRRNIWRPKGWKNPNLANGYKVADPYLAYNSFEAGADAMHKACVKWFIERIIHNDRGYVFHVTGKEWQEFFSEP